MAPPRLRDPQVGHNLVRNVTLTLGVGHHGLRVAVPRRWHSSWASTACRTHPAVEGDVEFIVFLNPDAGQDATDAIGDELRESPQVEEVTYVDQQAAFEEFQEMFANQPDMIQAVEPEILPPSYRVSPVDTDADAVRAFGDTFLNKPGVRDVAFAQEAVKNFQSFTGIISTGLLLGAIFLLGAAILLILNTIRMAMFARRREIEAMKLVGATNWFIRVLFMIEGSSRAWLAQSRPSA